MNIYEKIERISAAPSCCGRLKSEIRFASRISKELDGKFDHVVNEAADFIISALEKSNYITEELTQSAEEKLAPIADEAKSYTLHCVSHAHIDMNWMWGFQETSNVTLDTFRTVLRLMNEYPDFTYSQSQASTYAMCEELDPELFEELKKRVAEGRWEITASTWTEADKNIPSGESLSRHHLYTKEYMKERFGLDSDSLRLDFEPDTFGHSAFVPEILNEGGVKYYYHCRGDEIAYAYRYKAPSGAEVLCYQDPFFYNGIIDENVFEFLPVMREKCGIKTGLYVYGVGDHGGGPSRRDIERILKMREWPIAPKIVFSTYHKFFAELEQYKDSLEVVDRERNFIFTGCYSSQSSIKGGNRICEDRLFEAEAMTALSCAYSNGRPYGENYRKAWEKVLFNQFHDILPGSCVRDSREHAMGNYQNALSYINAGLTKGMLSLAQAIDSSDIVGDDDCFTISQGGGVGFESEIANRVLHTAAEYGSGKTRILHIFNPTNYIREEVTTVTVWDYTGDISRICVTDINGNDIPFVTGGRSDYWGHSFIKIDLFVKVPQFGFTTVVIKEKQRDSLPFIKQEIPSLNARREYFYRNTLENEKIKACFDDDMCLVSLIDKSTGHELIREKAGYFEYYVESGRIHMPNAWSEGPAVEKINMNEQGKIFVADRTDKNDLRQTIEYNLEFKNTKLTVVAALYKNSDVLSYDVTTDWHEDGHQGDTIPTMRFKVPLAYRCDEYLYDIPMGTITRGEFLHDVPGHSFAYAVGEDKSCGVALINDRQVAFRGMDDTLSTTILRATSSPDTYPEYGMHKNRVGIAVVPCDIGTIFKAACDFVHPLPFASVRPHKGTLPAEGSLMSATGDVVISAVKTPESGKADEFIVRFYSISGDEQDVKLSFARDVKSAYRTDTLERNIGELAVSAKTVTVNAAPYKTITVRVVF